MTELSPRDQLLDRVVVAVARGGLADHSLRALAAASGTSHRMLLYHFGSRDGLIAAIVGRIEADQRSAMMRLATEATSPTDLIRRQWAELTDPSVLGFVTLFFEATALALHGRPGTEGFLDALTESWLGEAEPVAARVGVAFDPVEVRLGVAVLRGLLLDAAASGDPAPATASLERFLSSWEQSR